ncbi:MAG: TorF family putative porin, partial [Candidatus Methylopumilus sp.]|nr:TorF family putative porin [Candidatus Methylopumilus sp.]
LITTAVLGALAAPSFVFAADVAPASDLTVAYNVGLYSQYIFRGLTQTDRKPALQGGVDLTHSSGFYLGAWGSNIDWLRSPYGIPPADTYYTKGGNLEIDLYGGFKTELGKSGIGIDVGALQYWYPGTLRGGWAKANTTELYGALSYGWLQAKLSGVVSNSAWGYGKNSNAPTQDDARGTYYAELNATIPIGDLVGGGALKGVTGLIHVARQDFDGNLNEPASYNDWKLGLQKSFESGVNVGAYYTDTNARTDMWTFAGKNIGDATGTAYIQKTF